MMRAGFLFVVLLLAWPAFTDSALIPVDRRAEPRKLRQQALIAWDGKTQVMLTTANIRCDRPTLALEVMPLPRQPSLGIGRTIAFAETLSGLNSRFAQLKEAGYDFSKTEVKKIREAMEMEVEEIVVPEQMAVLPAADYQELEGLIKRRLHDAGMARPVIPEHCRAGLKASLAAGCKWFVFSLVRLGRGDQTRGAIHVTFATEQLFYPMRVNSRDPGEVLVKLLVMSNLVENTYGIPREKIELMHRPVPIHPVNMIDIDKPIYRLFQNEAYVFLRIWHVEGDYRDFQADLRVD